VLDLFANKQLNHHTEIVGGLLAEPASKLLREFFAERRAQLKAERDAARELDEPIPVGHVIETPPDDGMQDKGA
jgi:tRNA(adenine34) deaminase